MPESLFHSRSHQSRSCNRECELCNRLRHAVRHTCLTRWAPHMDPWTLAYLAGHRDLNITKRYIHPQHQTVLDAMEKAQGGHNSGHNREMAPETAFVELSA